MTVLFQHCTSCEHRFSISGKNFLWVEIHKSYTAQKMLESRSYAGTLRESHICRTQFP